MLWGISTWESFLCMFLFIEHFFSTLCFLKVLPLWFSVARVLTISIFKINFFKKMSWMSKRDMPTFWLDSLIIPSAQVCFCHFLSQASLRNEHLGLQTLPQHLFLENPACNRDCGVWYDKISLDGFHGVRRKRKGTGGWPQGLLTRTSRK